MYDIVALGELLVDLIPAGTSDSGNALLEMSPGGAPANVLALAAKLGRKTALIGKVGADETGRFLRRTLQECGIDDSGLVEDPSALTALSLVQLDPKGERTFSFYRNPGADRLLTIEELNETLLTQCRLFHFCSLSLTHDPVRSATCKAVEIARSVGATVSFAPNLRESLWDDRYLALEMIEYGMQQCDILKLSLHELAYVTGVQDPLVASELVARQFSVPLVFVTMGEKGSFYRYGDIVDFRPAYRVNTIDTTGAGDAFFACVLSRLCQADLLNLDQRYLNALLELANSAAALVTTRKGALRSMPTVEEIAQLHMTAPLQPDP